MKDKTKESVKSPGDLTLEKAIEYAKADLKVAIGFLEFVLQDQEVIQLAANKMLLLQEQLKKNYAAEEKRKAKQPEPEVR